MQLAIVYFVILIPTIASQCADGHHLTKQILETCANSHAFAYLDEHATARSYGDPVYGGSLSKQNFEYKNITQITAYANGFGFLDTNETAHIIGKDAVDLYSVSELQSTGCALTVLHKNQTVSSVGSKSCGGSAPVLQNVTKLVAAAKSFAVLTPTGFHSWGRINTSISTNNIENVYSDQRGFVLDFKNGTSLSIADTARLCGPYICWTSNVNGSHMSCTVRQTFYCDTNTHLSQQSVLSYTTNQAGSAAVLDGYQVITWRNANKPPPGINDTGVYHLVSTNGAFAALTRGGDVLAWGDANYAIPQYFHPRQISHLAATDSTFSALSNVTGKLFVWGKSLIYGRQLAAVSALTTMPTAVLANHAFMNITVVGSVPYNDVLRPTASCKPCPANTFARADTSKCQPCPAGEWSGSGSAKCVACTFAVCDDLLLTMLLVGMVPFTLCICCFYHCRRSRQEELLDI
jgi:hypothetical protein